MEEARGEGPRLRFAGVVPAAGASRRMGQTKALLDLEGETFLARVVQALSGGGCHPVLVVSSGDEQVESEAIRAGARVIVNPNPGEGPITSLRLALGELSDTVDGIAYLPLDHPLVTPDVVSSLIGAACSTDAAITLPMFGDKRGHPALFRRTIFPELLDPGLEGGGRTVVHRHLEEACLLASSEIGVITDIDTPEAYTAALADRNVRTEALSPTPKSPI